MSPVHAQTMSMCKLERKLNLKSKAVQAYVCVSITTYLLYIICCTSALYYTSAYSYMYIHIFLHK